MRKDHPTTLLPELNNEGASHDWYMPFGERLWRAMAYHRVHQSEAYGGNPKKNKPAWPRWRKGIAHVFVVLSVFLSQPEYWIVGNFDLGYRQCARLRRLMHWETRLYLWATGYNLPN
jgi:hypothetical protein